ncbi:MAG: hypothetical protein HW387_958 [Parachlamydiales bacterium]|nr:hypothetical protein [Parachlamydiales bacterium]
MTMSLQNFINTRDISHELENVHEMLKNTNVGVNFWGTREVRSIGMKASTTLDKLSEKVVQAARQRCLARDLTLTDRCTGFEITGILQDFYQNSDVEIANRCFITRLLAHLREFTFFGKPTRLGIVGEDDILYLHGCLRDFRCYNQQQFKEQFPLFSEWPLCMEITEAIEGDFDSPDCSLIVYEKVIRKTLSEENEAGDLTPSDHETIDSVEIHPVQNV